LQKIDQTDDNAVVIVLMVLELYYSYMTLEIKTQAKKIIAVQMDFLGANS